MEMGELHAVTADLCGCNARLDLAQSPVAIQNIVDSRRIQCWRFLGHMGNFKTLGHIQLTLIGVEGAQHQLKETRLTGSVGAGNTNSVTPVQGE